MIIVLLTDMRKDDMTIRYEDKKTALNEIREMIRREIYAAGIDENSLNSNYLSITKKSPLFWIANSCIGEYSKTFSRRHSELLPTKNYKYNLICGQPPTETELLGNTTRKGFQVAAVQKLEEIFAGLENECPIRITKSMPIEHVRMIHNHIKKRGY